jgi:ribosome-binding factor A
MSGDGRRPRRVAEDIRNCLALAFSREFSDPRVSAAVITRVEITPDLGVAHVYVRTLIDANDKNVKLLTRTLQRAAGRLRRLLGQQLRLKRVPELRFQYDEAPDLRARVDELLAEVATERAASQEEASDRAAPSSDSDDETGR